MIVVLQHNKLLNKDKKQFAVSFLNILANNFLPVNRALCVNGSLVMGLDSNKKLKSYIEREQLYCVLNDTKWNKLFNCLVPYQDYLDFQRKDLDESPPIESAWNGDIYEIFGLSQKVEWINIHISKNHESDVLDVIKKANIPLSKNGENYRVWGYIRQGQNPEWFYT